jgi:hypothetical protein
LQGVLQRVPAVLAKVTIITITPAMIIMTITLTATLTLKCATPFAA